MYASEVRSRLDGILGTMSVGTTAATQASVAAWVQMCKDVVNLPGNRGLSTWKFQAISDIDEDGSAETGATDLIAATKLYAALVGSIDDTAEDGFVAFYDADSATFDGSAALNNGVVAVIRTPTVSSASAEEYFGCVWPHGIVLGTGLTVAADGVDGTNISASELRGWLLYI